MNMKTQHLYLEDPACLEFEANILESRLLANGRIGVILEQTYFYPTGGGQEHDTGKLGPARVLEVYKDETEGVLVHVIDRTLAPGKVRGTIDSERRLRHMQHHTAQHLLTQCFVRLFGFETISANINGYTPSTLDLPDAELSADDLEQAEALANQVIYQNREVKSYFVSPEQLEELPLRRPPKVNQDIRIVEIAGYDYSACGGTHCAYTGTIGVLKIIKTERVKNKTRVHFIAGMQAREHYRDCYQVLDALAAQMSVHPQDLPATVNRQSETLKAVQKELVALQDLKLEMEAGEIIAQAETVGDQRLVVMDYPGRSPSELRALAKHLMDKPSVVALLSSQEGQKVSLVVACAEGSRLDAAVLLNQVLGPLGGRGGGDERLAQGGGSADQTVYKKFVQEMHVHARQNLSPISKSD
jgi:alanyl-tRNA synthetase